MKFAIFTTCSAMILTASALAGNDPYGDIKDVKLIKAEDGEHVKSVPAPKEAIVLFDGKSLDEWVKPNGKDPVSWKLVDGSAMQVSGGNIITKQKFAGNFKLHVEFRVPYMPKASGQGRGNSGVYLQGRYEVQVLDSYGLKSKDNDCGGIYTVAAPLVNACKAPTIWQSYDIEFKAPVCENGKKKEPAVMTVYHNGIKIHNEVKITKDNTTAGLGGDVCTPGPIMLQDHGNPVQFRNIWIVPVVENGAKRGINIFNIDIWRTMSRDLFARILEVFLGRRPFSPFTVELLSGAKLEVNHPEALMLYERHFVYTSTTQVKSVMEYAVVQRFFEATGS